MAFNIDFKFFLATMFVFCEIFINGSKELYLRFFLHDVSCVNNSWTIMLINDLLVKNNLLCGSMEWFADKS